ncbi:hypothetical protein SAMN05428975_6010 [Mucilaginibacter sp. OK268]|jgi:hypothetical protein|uniref:hypothetical protein n=1 Tax=Mucilaginibacter sp. OK268 TaxID=1881048 RepID=UPI00088E89B2|nr:hypothetical protein [Mucilaginibacter sp. OK268]SDQ01781.1 hypothetical protein SAMN05428975_6010 [Mucilaginibacter sp. OK268]
MAAKHTLPTLANICFLADDMAASKCYAELLGIDAYFTSLPAGKTDYIEFCISDNGEESSSVYKMSEAA